MKLEKNGVRKKSFLGVLVFGHSCCLSINSTEFNVEYKQTCPFYCHIGSSINNISGHVLTCNCAKKIVLQFFVLNSPYINRSKFFERTAIKISFSFSSLGYLNRESAWKSFSQKRKVAIFFYLQTFVDITTFNSHSFNKVNDLVITQYTITIFYPFYLNPQS